MSSNDCSICMDNRPLFIRNCDGRQRHTHCLVASIARALATCCCRRQGRFVLRLLCVFEESLHSWTARAHSCAAQWDHCRSLAQSSAAASANTPSTPMAAAHRGWRNREAEATLILVLLLGLVLLLSLVSGNSHLELLPAPQPCGRPTLTRGRGEEGREEAGRQAGRRKHL